MSISQKLKEKGLKGAFTALGYKARGARDKAFRSLFSLAPVDSKKLIFESEGDYTDNARAFYEYLKREGIADKYEIFWLCDHPETTGPQFGLKALKKRNSLKTLYHLTTCSKYIYDHNHLLSNQNERPGQQSVYLGHGIGFKGSMAKKKPKGLFDLCMTTGPLRIDCMSVFWNCDPSAVQTCGYSRLDVLFQPFSETQKKVKQNLFENNVRQYVLWMPTFRKSNNASLDMDVFPSIPMFETASDLDELNRFLEKENIGMVLKVHHLAKGDPIYDKDYSHLKFLWDEDLAEKGLSLYEFVALFDALVTDYSSISTDFLITDRPMIFQLQDYDLFEKERGLWLENTKDYMPGPHCYTREDLYKALADLGFKDDYKEARKALLPQFFTYPDGLSSRRIAGLLDL